MATLEETLYARISPLCARVYPDVAPLDTVRPYVTWQQVGGTSPIFTDNTLPSKRNAEMQINVWGDTRASVTALAQQIEAALCATPTADFVASPIGAHRADYDHDNMIFGTIQDFTLWNTRP